MEYNNDWGEIQKRFLPCKSTHQIFVRQKNRTTCNAPDNPVKEVRRMKTSPLSTEEIQRIEEGLKIFKNDWTSVWKFVVPHRDPAHLQLQWRVATGVQRSYSKSDAGKERRRLNGAKRRKLKASVPDSRVNHGQEADNDASEGVENDDDSFVNDASLADAENRSINMTQAGTSDNAANDLFPVPPPTFTECVYTQLNSFPDRSTSDMSQQHGICNGNAIEDGAEQDFLMHPLLFQHPREVLSSYSHPCENLIRHTRNYDVFPFEKVQVEKSNKQSTDGMEGAPANADTIFHPLLQRTVDEMLEEVPEKDCHQFANQSDCGMREPPVDDQSTVRETSTNPCVRENSTDLQASTRTCEREINIDVDIPLCYSTDFRNAKDFRSTVSKSSCQPEVSMKDRASASILEPGNACCRRDIEQPSKEEMRGIVMEREELSDSEEDSEHVEFECEEIDDSEEEQVQDAEPCLTENKEEPTVICSSNRYQAGPKPEELEGSRKRQVLNTKSSDSGRSRKSLALNDAMAHCKFVVACTAGLITQPLMQSVLGTDLSSTLSVDHLNRATGTSCFTCPCLGR
uniref:Uncharacterized protein n=1 Tax=Avena sativa TaxID=4498 RepID=A0ACD5ZQ20_AVESA